MERDFSKWSRNRNEVIFGSDGKAKGMEYMRKDSISINDGTPGGTVKLKSQVVGNSNYELSKITYFIEDTGKNSREGVKVIMYDGKIQSVMPFKVPIK